MPTSVIERELRCYAEMARDEPWKRNHVTAMAWLELDQLLKFGMYIYDALIELDEVWRDAVLSGHLEYCPDVQGTIRRPFDLWLEPCQKLETAIRHFEDRGYVVDRAPDFRKRHAEAAWIVRKAADVFASDRFVALRDAALDEHAKGNTAPI